MALVIIIISVYGRFNNNITKIIIIILVGGMGGGAGRSNLLFEQECAGY
jgi:hypothetical protein